MNKNLILSILLAGFLSLSLASPVMADCKGGHCPMKKYGQSDCCGKGNCGGKGEYQCPIVGKIMKKAHFFLDNQKEIGLTDDQVKTIKSIKMETKKAYIRQEAEMKVFHLDLEQKLSENPVDEQSLNAMMDSASAGFASGGKAALASYVKLKAVLNEGQMNKAKEIWSQKKSH